MSNSAAGKARDGQKAGLLGMTAEIVAAYLGRSKTDAQQVPDVINTVFQALAGLEGRLPAAEAEPLKPATPVKKSVQPDFLICLEDGKKLRMLKRYLRTTYNMSPEEYRNKWGLPADYPMVAPNYAKQRSDFAKKIGLGKSASPRAAGRKGAARG